MRKVFVEHKFFTTEESPEKDFEYSYPESVCWGTYPEDEPKEGDWFLYVDIESYIQLQEENKLLRECVEFYADERNYVKKQYDLDPTLLEKPEFLNGWYVGGKLARETLVKIKGDV